MAESVTRLAPSPTGALHVGNARTFLLNHLLAAASGWRMLMRVEDLDGPRVQPGSEEAMLETLQWLGLTWEEPVVRQSGRADVYADALARLVEMGAAYPCVCSRKDVELAASAPHADDGAATYPGTCRDRFLTARDAAATGLPVAWRVRVTDDPVVVEDRFAGRHEFNLARTGGDFVVIKKDRLAAYQLAVTVDDAAAGVDAIVRGHDLLDSAARQMHLRRLLDLFPEPAYWHLPLVIGPDGRRLAKRHGDTRIEYYRQAGTTPERMLGVLAFLSGLLDERREANMDELAARFDLGRLSPNAVVFAKEDNDFLLGAEARRDHEQPV